MTLPEPRSTARDPDAPPVPPFAAWLTRVLRPRRPDPAAALEFLERGPVRRILAIKVHDQLGDFLVATPALAALRARWPDARLTLVTRAYLAPLATRNRLVDEVRVLPPVRGPRGLGALGRTLGAVAGAPELCVVLNSVSRSRTADALAALSRARVVVGRARAVGGPLPHSAPRDASAAALERRDPVYDLDVPAARGHEHFVERALDLVRPFAPPASDRLVLDLGEGERESGRRRLAAAAGAAGLDAADLVAGGVRDPGRPWIGIHPGAANALKCWPIDSFAALAARLASAGARLVVVDSPREPDRAPALLARLERLGIRAARVPTPRLEDFLVLAPSLGLLVCNDSGTMHVAAALGVPTLSFHSLGPPEQWAPRGEAARALHAVPIETIGVDAAWRAAQELLRRSAGAAS